ncbi:MAG: hypothetical protein QXI36_02285 [Candidatus Bathyarchaeia archaeon]
MSAQEARALEASAAFAVILLIVVLAMFSTNLAGFLSIIEYVSPLTFEKYPFFIWTYRGLDMLIQAFLLLATTLGVTAILREDEGPGVEEEPVVVDEEEG